MSIQRPDSGSGDRSTVSASTRCGKSSIGSRATQPTACWVPDRSTCLRDYLEYWLREIASHKRATTLRGYESAVRLHIVPVLGTKRLDRLTGADVRQLIAVCRQKCLSCANGYDKNRAKEKQCCSVGRSCSRRPSRRQIQYIHSVLRNTLSNAEREELITRNVAKLVQIPTPRYKVG
jgi:integrase-like protein